MASLDKDRLIRKLLSFVLAILNIVCNFVFGLVSALEYVIALFKMSKLCKRKNRNRPHETVVDRGIINANWQNLLASNWIEKKTEKSAPTDNYPVTFRRNRKKNTINNTVSAMHQYNLKTMNSEAENVKNNNKQSSEHQFNIENNTLTKFIAMDCEMVGVGFEGSEHMLARVSLVNKFGVCVYDKFVKPREEVIDYRTKISGIRKEDLLNGEDFTTVQKEVAEILKGRILVGHSLKNDLGVLYLSHPKRNIRDTSKFKPFRKITKGSTPSLKRLSKEILDIDIQSGEHSSVEDARAAMQLYCTVAKVWENSLSSKKRGTRLGD